MKRPLSVKKLGFSGMVATVLKIQPIFMLGGELGFMLAWVNYEYIGVVSTYAGQNGRRV